MNKFPKLIDNIEINMVEDGYIIYQSEKERVHYLNNSAVLLLECCTGKNSVEKIESIVQEAFDLPKIPKKEINECLNTLSKEGLIKQFAKNHFSCSFAILLYRQNMGQLSAMAVLKKYVYEVCKDNSHYQLIGNGKRFLMVGDLGFGKTTLMTRLLFEGLHVDGDELVLIRDGKTVRFPWCFQI